MAFWAWLDRGLWFFGDEWDFLVDRGLGAPPASTHSIWFPHNEHWSTLPVLAWRALFAVWHLSSYWPYLALLFAVQVALLHLAWRACRRAGADTWISTAAVLLLGLLGAGAEDWGWAFQVGFAGSVCFGLLAMDLLDRDERGFLDRDGRSSGPGWRRRELAVSCALLASLMCSTVGDAMVVGAAVTAFARFGWRQAARALWAPVVCYAVWFAGVGRLGLAAHSDHFSLATFTGLPGYLWQGLSSALGQVAGLGSLGPALLVGLVAWLAWHGRELWTRRPVLAGLCAAAVSFYGLVGVGRDTAGPPDASRYTYVAFAVLLPVVASVLSAPLGRAPMAGRAVAACLLLFVTLGDVGQAKAWVSARSALTSRLKEQLFAVGELVSAGVPDVSGPGAAPVPGDPNLQVADIARLEREGFLPRPPLSAVALSNARAVLALGVWNGLDMTLSRAPLFAPRLQLVAAHFAARGPGRGSCATFSPQTLSPPMSLLLRVPARARSASVLLAAGPAGAASAARHVDAFFVPAHGPSSTTPIDLAFPAGGRGWLDDNAPGSAVVLDWTGPGPLYVCGQGRPALSTRR